MVRTVSLRRKARQAQTYVRSMSARLRSNQTSLPYHLFIRLKHRRNTRLSGWPSQGTCSGGGSLKRSRIALFILVVLAAPGALFAQTPTSPLAIHVGDADLLVG